MTHKPPSTAIHHVDKHARHVRKMARKKLRKGLIADPRTGYKIRNK